MIKYTDNDVIVTYYYLNHPRFLSKNQYYLTKSELLKGTFSEDVPNIQDFIVEEIKIFTKGTYLITDNGIPVCVSNDFEILLHSIQKCEGFINMYLILSSGLPIKITL